MARTRVRATVAHALLRAVSRLFSTLVPQNSYTIPADGRIGNMLKKFGNVRPGVLSYGPGESKPVNPFADRPLVNPARRGNSRGCRLAAATLLEPLCHKLLASNAAIRKALFNLAEPAESVHLCGNRSQSV